jgi:pyruvate dehydrogenase E1 component alpha subunit
MNIPSQYTKVRDVKITSQELIDFEDRVKLSYESGKVKGPIHLSKNNEIELIEIFQYIHNEDWVFSAWRNHYHALLHGVDPDKLFNSIVDGKSMGTNNLNPNFYASSIVGGIIPIALGVALGLKRKNSSRRVWCFIGDMTMETGVFWEAYKYSQNLNLPLQFVVEDNNLSVHTPTDVAWGKRMNVPNNVIYYSYKMEYPHHGTGKWVNF